VLFNLPANSAALRQKSDMRFVPTHLCEDKPI
jgi:hypothetical protein